MKDEQYDNEIADILHGSIRVIKGEYIICAANWYKDKSSYPHQPRNINYGFVVCGRRHHNCFATVSIIRKKSIEDQPKVDIEQGFLTSKDRFITREEAGKLALESNQITQERKTLFSEDLY